MVSRAVSVAVPINPFRADRDVFYSVRGVGTMAPVNKRRTVVPTESPHVKKFFSQCRY